MSSKSDLVKAFAIKPDILTWTIEEFSNVVEPEQNRELRSPKFGPYQLLLHPNGELHYRSNRDDYNHRDNYRRTCTCKSLTDKRIFIWLRTHSLDKLDNYLVYCGISILDGEGKKCFPQGINLTIQNNYFNDFLFLEGRVLLSGANTHPKACSPFSMSHSFLLDSANKLLVNGKLTIFCEVLNFFEV